MSEEFVVLGGVVAREEDGLRAEAVAEIVAGGGGFAFGGDRAGGELGVGLVGCELSAGHGKILSVSDARSVAAEDGKSV